MSRPSGRARRRLAWAVAAVVALGLAVAAVVVLTGRPGDVSNPDVEFEQAPPTAPSTPKSHSGSNAFDDKFSWPLYGLTKARTRYLPLQRNLRPPFTIRWRLTGRVLLEFTPVLCGRYLYLLKNNGALYAIRRSDGHVRWKVKLGNLAAASPACGNGTVYAVLLTRGKGVKGGRVTALRTRDGSTRWSRKLPSRSESSPLLDSGRLYFGSEDGTVYALRASNGDTRWTYKARGAVKSGLSLDDHGRLFFGDYAGQVTALRQADGSRIWRTGTEGGAFGLRSGNFYATPSVAYGRVYLGSTDGFVYSFAARTGELAWRHRTGNYVYSSPAIGPYGGGTVYAGSYDGKLYAFDARSGSVRWTRTSGGKISGGPVVIGDLVFYSNLSRKSTAAAGAATGQTVWRIGRGGFNPVISDGTRLYLNGYSSLYMLAEKGRSSKTGALTTAARERRRNHLRAVAIRRHRRYLARRAAIHKRYLQRRTRQAGR